MAELFLKQNRMEDAVKHFNKAILLKSENPKLFFGRGIALSALGKISKAIEDFTRVVELAPNFFPVFNRRGTNYEKLAKFKLAAEDFHRAIALNEQDAQAYNNLAWLQATCPDPEFRNGKQSTRECK